MLILVRGRILAALVDVLDGDESLERPVLVHHRELLDLVLPQDPLRLLERGADRCGHQTLGGHHLADGPAQVTRELQVAIRDDADQEAVPINHRDTRDLEARHQRDGFAECGVGRERVRIQDHAAFRALHAVHLGRLPVDGHVLVQHAYATGTRHRDGHLGLGDRVHRRRHERDIQRDASREATRRVDVARMRGRVTGQKQDVVERQGHRLTHTEEWACSVVAATRRPATLVGVRGP